MFTIDVTPQHVYFNFY